MKRILLPSITLLLAILLIAGFSSRKKLNPPGAHTTSAATACIASPDIIPISDAEFKARYHPDAVLVRKNVYSLSAAEISSIKAGVTAMKALPYTDNTSWLYQAAIHGTTLPDNLPSWNSCHKAGAAFFFLAWHRMYVYFFERILRAKSGNPNLALPYWDYQTNAVMPPDWRNSDPANPLYDATRSATINAGGSLPASIMVAFNNALAFVPYYDFQTSLNGPHGSVHTTINGNMYSTSTAAKDPVFWLHHCNIDRLWEVWLRQCGGRASPSDNAWLTKTYTFYDENGLAVNMSGSQVINTASQLNYRYDLPFKIPCNLLILNKWIFAQKIYLIRKVAPVAIDSRIQKLNFQNEKTGDLEAFMRKNNKSRINFTDTIAPEKLVISLGGIKVEKMPEGVVEVYLNQPAGAEPNPNGKNFVGLLDLFSAAHHQSMQMNMGDTEDTELDASKAAKALGLTLADLKNAEISFVVRGNSLKGMEVKTSAKVTIQRTALSIHSLNR